MLGDPCLNVVYVPHMIKAYQTQIESNTNTTYQTFGSANCTRSVGIEDIFVCLCRNFFSFHKKKLCRWCVEMIETSRIEKWNDALISDDEEEEKTVGPLSGLNDRTFPRKKNVWKSISPDGEFKVEWSRVGEDVFDFRVIRGKGSIPLEDEVYVLNNGKATATCKVFSAHLQTPQTIGNSVAPGHDRPVYSKNCGRAVLELLKFEKKKRMRRTRGTTRERIAEPVRESVREPVRESVREPVLLRVRARERLREKEDVRETVR